MKNKILYTLLTITLIVGFTEFAFSQTVSENIIYQ